MDLWHRTAMAVTDSDGYVTGTLKVNEGEGTTQLLVSDGVVVLQVTEINISPSTLSEAEPSSDQTTDESPSATPGSDPEGDGKNGESQDVSEDEDVPGADIKSVRHVRDSSGNHCFFIEVYGDGKRTAMDPEEAVGDYLISVEIRGANGWGTRVQFRQGEAQSGVVRIGEKTSGRDTLEGAEATVEWTDDHTMKVTVRWYGTWVRCWRIRCRKSTSFRGVAASMTTLKESDSPKNPRLPFRAVWLGSR